MLSDDRTQRYGLDDVQEFGHMSIPMPAPATVGNYQS